MSIERSLETDRGDPASPSFSASVRATPIPRLDLSLILRPLLWLIVFAPAIFFVLAVQHSAIVFPFWDHCELIKYFAKIHDHTLRISELWAPHNHARPLVYRAILLLNGLLTDWEIASEYLYLIASVVLAFVLQGICLRRLCGGLTLRCLALLLVLSVFSFSPAGHNNHWWSCMLMLDLAHAFIVAAFICVCLGPRAWKNNLIAALACWFATYTLSNGLIAFAAAAMTVHLSKRPTLRFDRFTLFWTINILAVLTVYLPGLNEKGGDIKHIGRLIEFCLAYLGSPLGSLLAFPFRNMFDVPPVTLRNAVIGALLLLTTASIFLFLKRKIDRAEPSALLFACFSLFAIGSAILTGWGRAEFDALGVANANASRYTLFSTYLLYGLIYAAAVDWEFFRLPEWARLRDKTLALRIAVVTLGVVFLTFAAQSYVKSIPIYHEAHDFNRLLAGAFWANDPSDQKYVYPNLPVLQTMEADLKRLRIGPYRFVHPDASDATPLLAGHKTMDQFGTNGLKELPALGTVLFANPGSRFELQVSNPVVSIHFQFGIADTAIGAFPAMAGVEFRVVWRHGSARDKVLWSRILRPASELKDRGLQSAEVRVSSSGADQLLFETVAVADPQGCWAYWRNVKIQN
jgi:hypothetical protein